MRASGGLITMKCETCEHQDLGWNDVPCLVCGENPKADGTRRGPRTADVSREPCSLTGRSCRTCMHGAVPVLDTDREACHACGEYFAHWCPWEDYNEKATGGV